MADIRLIALDLDGTLLNANKEILPASMAVLSGAAAAGIEIVPATGRFFAGMPACVRSLSFLHYAITVNGAEVYDIRQQRPVAAAEIPCAQAISIMEYLDTLPVIYDCYMGGWGWMTRSMQQRVPEFAPDRHYREMLQKLRTPVDELKAYLRAQEKNVQKVQFFTKDMALRQEALRSLGERFPNTVVSTSVVNNVEINNIHANKGEALKQLADYLEIPVGETMAFGDGMNDLTMLRAAGIGVAMGNADEAVKAAADAVTESCDEDGVAKGILRFCRLEGVQQPAPSKGDDGGSLPEDLT